MPPGLPARSFVDHALDTNRGPTTGNKSELGELRRMPTTSEFFGSGRLILS